MHISQGSSYKCQSLFLSMEFNMSIGTVHAIGITPHIPHSVFPVGLTSTVRHTQAASHVNITEHLY